MVMKGETITTGAPNVCPDCKTITPFKVLQSGAGYYIGTMCQCEPYSRESGYYTTRKKAEEALKSNSFWR